MEIFNRKKHWENIYRTKELKDVSWFQPTPETSLDFLKQFSVSTSANIIDIGGGDSFLVDHLLNLGYQNISVLDISSTAIGKAKERLGERANKVKWIVADAATFKPTEKYDFWHDRAAFHFLTDEQEISNYLETAQQSINPTGVLIIGTFSEQGPKKCSGIEIKQYSETTMTDRLKKFFEKIKCVTVEHKTPSDTIQNFVFCSFRKTATVYNGNQVELNSTITCPNCGHKKTEIMPTGACVYFYECENCKTRLKPLQGDCCIYCSYGTVKCPPIQEGTSCC